jgi:hypothetical protein
LNPWAYYNCAKERREAGTGTGKAKARQGQGKGKGNRNDMPVARVWHPFLSHIRLRSRPP